MWLTEKFANTVISGKKIQQKPNPKRARETQVADRSTTQWRLSSNCYIGPFLPLCQNEKKRCCENFHPSSDALTETPAQARISALFPLRKRKRRWFFFPFFPKKNFSVRRFRISLWCLGDELGWCSCRLGVQRDVRLAVRGGAGCVSFACEGCVQA